MPEAKAARLTLERSLWIDNARKTRLSWSCGNEADLQSGSSIESVMAFGQALQILLRTSYGLALAAEGRTARANLGLQPWLDAPTSKRLWQPAFCA